jgi:hypothetical protein
MALWEAPMTATVVGVWGGRVVASSDGLRTVSRSRRVMSRPGTGTGMLVGWDPVQRIRRVVSIVSSSGEPCCLMRTVHWESLDVCLYDVIISLFCVRCAET